MAIETTEFANISISVSPTGVSSGNFGILGFLTPVSDTATNSILAAERGRAYTSLPSVGIDWPVTSEVYKAATAFYGQTPQPKDFTVLMSYDVAQTATLVGGGHDSIEDLIAVSSGSLDITIDGTLFSSTTVDLSGESTHAEVAAELTVLIAAVITGTVVSYGPYGYLINGFATGSGSGSITFGTGGLSDALGLSQHQGKVSQGIDIETPVGSLASATALGIDFVGLVTNKTWRDVLSGATGTTTLEIGQWAEAAKKIFCNTTNSLSALNSAINTDIGSVAKTAALRYMLTSFSKNVSLYPSASVFGRAASVNFAGINTTITLNLKQMPGITAEDLTPAEFATLRSKNISAVVQIGKSTFAYTDSRMASGSWLDTTHGLLWLENRGEVDMFNLMYQTNTRIPFTQEGINTAAGTLNKSCQAAVRNGLAGPGYLPDGTYLPEGFRINVVPLADVASSDKSNRVYNGLSFDMVGQGALHEVTISGSFSE